MEVMKRHAVSTFVMKHFNGKKSSHKKVLSLSVSDDNTQILCENYLTLQNFALKKLPFIS
jgi:hypothetical protein